MSNFGEFLETVGESSRDFVSQLNAFLLEKGCKCSLKTAKSGFVVSYVRGDNNKMLLNFVMRKSGTQARIYAAHSGEYGDFLDTLPEKVKSKTKKSTDCRKLNGTGDDPHCTGGYEFTMDGEVYRKCRSNAFLIPLSEENNGFIREFLERELRL